MNATAPITAIKSPADLDSALAELGRLQAIEAGLKAQCNREITAVKEKFQARMVTSCQQGISTRCEEIEDLITGFCTPRKAELLQDVDGKTLKLTHGAIAWRLQPLSIVALEGHENRWAKRVEDARRHIARALKTVFAVGKLPILRLMRVNLEFDKAAAAAMFRAGTTSNAELKRTGWQVVEGQEELVISPAKVAVESHSDQPPAPPTPPDPDGSSPGG